MRFVKYLPLDCACCWCGKNFQLNPGGYTLSAGGTVHENCYLEIYNIEKKAKKEALASFYNDPDARAMLSEKLAARDGDEKMLARIRRALYSLSPTLSLWQARQPKIDLEALKLIPIGDLISYPAKRKYGQKEMYNCPLHSPDNTPSFQWDKKINRFKCWSCGEWGDSISLYMKLNNCDFKAAISQLSRCG